MYIMDFQTELTSCVSVELVMNMAEYQDDVDEETESAALCSFVVYFDSIIANGSENLPC